MIALSLLSLLLAPAALAGPWRRSGFQGTCSVNQTFSVGSLPPMSGPPSLVLLGVGVQNYTCNANGTFDSVGALGELWDISCLVGQPEFNTIPADALNVYGTTGDVHPFDGNLAQAIQNSFNLTVTGQHYFQEIDGKLTPIWDMRSAGEFQGNAGAIVIAKVDNSISSPDDPVHDVNWLQLEGTSGSLASELYRINTAGGQPPPNCAPGDTTSVNYASKYCML